MFLSIFSKLQRCIRCSNKHHCLLKPTPVPPEELVGTTREKKGPVTTPSPSILQQAMPEEMAVAINDESPKTTGRADVIVDDGQQSHQFSSLVVTTISSGIACCKAGCENDDTDLSTYLLFEGFDDSTVLSNVMPDKFQKGFRLMKRGEKVWVSGTLFKHKASPVFLVFLQGLKLAGNAFPELSDRWNMAFASYNTIMEYLKLESPALGM